MQFTSLYIFMLIGSLERWQWNTMRDKTQLHGLYWLSKRGQGTSLSCTVSFLLILTLE